jgi:hypothetical protein
MSTAVIGPVRPMIDATTGTARETARRPETRTTWVRISRVTLAKTKDVARKAGIGAGACIKICVAMLTTACAAGGTKTVAAAVRP